MKKLQISQSNRICLLTCFFGHCLTETSVAESKINGRIHIADSQRRNMKTDMKILFWLCLVLVLACQSIQAQVAQPYITVTSPLGAKRGTKATFTIDGYNLSDAGEIIWNKPGITSRIILNSELIREPHKRPSPTALLIIDKSTKHRLTIEASIAADASPGVYDFRVRTPLGTTNAGSIIVGALPETRASEMIDRPEQAQTITLPITVVGALQNKGESDYFKFTAKAGQQIVFEVIAAALNSRLDSVLTLFDNSGFQLAANNDNNGNRDSVLGYRFRQDGEYLIRISDLEQRGDVNGYGYRLNIGELAYLTGTFPIGVREGVATEVETYGFNLPAAKARVVVQKKTKWNETVSLVMGNDRTEKTNTIKLAVGSYPELMEQSMRTSIVSPQTVNWPATINGKIHDSNAASDEDFYRFKAKKGQHVVLEVGAQRYGSPLDAVIEVLDSKGNRIPRVMARCLLETQLTLNDRDSASRGFRITHWNGIQVNDYLMAGNELVQVDVLPKTPDEDIFFKSFQGQRLTFEDTTPEAHANGSTACKVSLHPPGTKLSPNGLPIVTFYYRNDDGGPMYGKDSRLNFVAPEDGDYIVRITDVRGLQGERSAYRLTIREPEPDFVLFADPENPNIPAGSMLPINVTVFRNDSFDGEVNVKLIKLPEGFTASGGMIRSGQNSTVITISAAVDAKGSFPLRIQADAMINGKKIIREIEAEERIALVSVVPPPELLVWTDSPQVVLEPGGKANVSIRIKRERGFAGRVPFDVRNLPPGVIVTDVGLNGVLITEEETSQQFTLAAEDWVKPLEQPVFIVGRIETTSPQRSDFTAQPLKLVIKSKASASNK